MSTNQIIEQKRICTKKLFLDLPQRVIVHKILIMHKLSINLRDEKNPLLLFGYFKYDRLRNIWFIFSSIQLYDYSRQMQGIHRSHQMQGNLIVDYSKLCNIYFDEVIIPEDIVIFSHKMYNLRSVVVVVADFIEESPFPKGFFSESKFPKLKTFFLKTYNSEDFFSRDSKDWHAIEFFNQLKSLSFGIICGYTNIDFHSFFRAKEKIFGKNMKKLNLRSIKLEEEVIISLPNLEILILESCRNLFIIPSEKRLRDISLSSTQEIDQIALNSRNAKSISIRFLRSGKFFHLFEKEDFPNLKELGITLNLSSEIYEIEEKWKFSSQIRLLMLSDFRLNPYLFQKNEWDELVQLTIRGFTPRIHIKDVKFPKLRILKISSCEISDKFFNCFEGKVLEVLSLRLNLGFPKNFLLGKGWNKNIFRSLEVLEFTNEFDDYIFQENEFPSLKKMIMQGNRSLEDKESWKEMKSLEEIKAMNCRVIKNWKRK